MSSLNHVMIMGSGIAGPLAALAILRRTDIPSITIFEKRAIPATIGGAISLAPNALRILARLGIDTSYGAPSPTILLQNEDGVRIGEISYGDSDRKTPNTPPQTINFDSTRLHSSSGSRSRSSPKSAKDHSFRHFFPCDYSRGYEGTRVLRTDLHASILDALIPYEDEGRLKIIYGADTIDIQENGDGVTLIFPDNQTFTGDLLLAADGIHSFTRSYLHKNDAPWLKPRAVYSGITLTYGIVDADSLPRSYTSPLRTHATIGTLSRDAGLFTMASATKDGSRLYWFATRRPKLIPDPDQEEERPAAIRRDLLDNFGSFPSPIPDFIRATVKVAYWPVYTLKPPLYQWYSDKGRIVLLGDAAHPMAPFASQGVGMAVEDAAMIANILAAVSANTKASISAQLWEREYQGRREGRVRAFMEKAEAMNIFNAGDRANGWMDDPEDFKAWATWALLPAMSYAGSEKDTQGWAYDIDEDTIDLQGLFDDDIQSGEGQPPLKQ